MPYRPRYFRRITKSSLIAATREVDFSIGGGLKELLSTSNSILSPHGRTGGRAKLSRALSFPAYPLICLRCKPKTKV